jgi:hypothetical protein
MADFFVYGLQRSGTNFVEQALQNTYGFGRSGAATNRSKHPHWKHAIEPAQDLPKDVPIIIIYKSIYNWIESITTRQVMDYLRTQTHYPVLDTDYIIKSEAKDKKVKLREFSIDQMCKTYNHFYSHYLPLLQTHNAALIQYEDLLTSKRAQIEHQLIDQLGLEQKEWIWPQQAARYTDQFTKDRAQSYLAGQWLPKPEQAPYAHIIEDVVDQTLEGKLYQAKTGPQLPEPIWNQWIDRGQVSEYYLHQLVWQLKRGLPLSPMMASLYPDHAAWIELQLMG